MHRASSTAKQQPSGGGTAFPPILAQSLSWVACPGAQQGASAVAGCGRIAAEWQGFVYRRLGKDAQLAAELATAKSPDELWGRYADFLREAAQDYWDEYAALARLSSEIVHESMEAARTDADAHEPATAPVAQAA